MLKIYTVTAALLLWGSGVAQTEEMYMDKAFKVSQYQSVQLESVLCEDEHVLECAELSLSSVWSRDPWMVKLGAGSRLKLYHDMYLDDFVLADIKYRFDVDDTLVTLGWYSKYHFKSERTYAKPSISLNYDDWISAYASAEIWSLGQTDPTFYVAARAKLVELDNFKLGVYVTYRWRHDQHVEGDTDLVFEASYRYKW